ncbi:3-phosphoshikimate 1-carboxyvinyltransferase [Flavitalea sp.]|nr:3-phosphoshikimate 1-carboxyvinyltransferase [Flavitalea sp.]
MIATVTPSFLTGSIQAPTSKSSMQRACAAALLVNGTSIIKNPGHSNDDRAAIEVITALGAKVYWVGGNLEIVSSGVKPVSNTIDCGESGLGIRMFTPIAALSEQAITITGSGSLTTRPMNFFDEIFPLLGITIQSNSGKLPLQINGPLKPANIEVDGSLSSQFLTGLLMAFAAAGASDVAIKVNNLTSKPYIDLTLAVMKHFGVQVENRNYESFYFPPKKETAGYQPHSYTVEGDWSGAAFLLVAGAIAGNITVKGLDVHSTQADKAVLHALSAAGAVMSIETGQINIATTSLKAFQFNAMECPDLFPPLVALAACCEGKSVIEGVNRLAHKESDRGLTLQEEFGKMGIKIVLQDNLMIIEGSTGLKGATVHSRHDHRIAMACAVAALKADKPVIIEVADAINKSYPDFYDNIRLLGANVEYK